MKYDPPVESIELNTKGKPWVEVTFTNGIRWRPRLWEVGAIISGIGKAEDKKYPNGKGHVLTMEFIEECWGKTRDEIYELALSAKYDPNEVMQSRYRKKQCIICGAWHDEDGDECGLCSDATTGFNNVDITPKSDQGVAE